MIVWVDFSHARGREQGGTRPALVVSSIGYLANVPDLVIVVPLTTVNRGWPHHVLIEGAGANLARPSYAMTEQPRTISRERIKRRTGEASARTVADVDQWLRDFIGL
jgi:mRNA interferase MazF